MHATVTTHWYLESEEGLVGFRVKGQRCVVRSAWFGFLSRDFTVAAEKLATRQPQSLRVMSLNPQPLAGILNRVVRSGICISYHGSGLTVSKFRARDSGCHGLGFRV